MKPFSVIIPVYNEEKLLSSQIEKLLSGIKKLNLPVNFEILLVENGSTDNTCRIAARLADKFKNIKKICLSRPSYGRAFKAGIETASYPYIFQFDIDFWDVSFIAKSQMLLEKYDFVIGSKNLNGSRDHRSILRKLISRLLEKIIEIRFNSRLTDTHGLKALKKSVISEIIEEVKCSNHFFDSELLLKANSYGYSFAELPVSLKELRPSRFPFYLRFREVIKEFILLMSIKLKRQSGTVPAMARLSPIKNL